MNLDNNSSDDDAAPDYIISTDDIDKGDMLSNGLRDS